MSRWQEQFDNHPFQQIWTNLKDIIEVTKVDDESIVTNTEELARLIKVLKFVDALIEASDPELVPLTTWTTFQSQCQACLQEVTNYNNNRNIQHIINANANADNLLTYVRPYVVESGKAAKAAQTGFREYSSVVTKGLENFKIQASEYLNEFQGYRSSTEEKYEELKVLHTEISALRKEYFEGTDSEEALEDKINSMFTTTNEHYSKITEYHTALLDNGSDSIQAIIAEAKTDSEENKEAIESLLHDTEKKLNELKVFYKDIYGSEDVEGKLIGGLKQELTDRKVDLDSFKELQQTRYKALNGQIEELLPAATSAGLATAYRAMRKSFSKPIKQYSYLFYSSVVILTLTTLVSSVDSFWTANEIIKFVDITDLAGLLNSLLHKLPIIVPVLWLALFASKRRSEAQRLQQEYAHKEALAKSYQNFKTQIDNLGQTDKKEELMEKLLSAAIDAVAANASDTLDKKHGDKTPAHEGLDKVVSSLEKLKGMIK
jgi:hypothetical protein